MTRSLHVFIDEAPVGVLYENSGIWSFQYFADWVTNGYELSPGLARTNNLIEDSGTIRPVQWFFDNLLPEDAARAALYATLPNKAGDAWDLLAQYGAESAGALTLLPPNTTQIASGLQPLSEEALHARVLAMPRQPLAAKAPKKMSMAGAQEKLAIVMDDNGQLFDPIGSRASTHILKPDVLSPHYPSSAINEWFCARLAQALKLPVPPVSLRYVPSSIYIIERFDRKFLKGRVERLHTLDALQLLSLAAGTKYSQSSADALNNVVAKCRTRAPVRLALLRWTLFNAFIGNSDAHLKNLSLFISHKGYALAPHYDLLSTAAWARPELVRPGEAVWPHVSLSYPIGRATTFADLTAHDFALFGATLGIPLKLVDGELKRMAQTILPAAKTLLAQYAARADVPPNRRAGELSMLQSILHLPLTDMHRRIATGL